MEGHKGVDGVPSPKGVELSREFLLERCECICHVCHVSVFLSSAVLLRTTNIWTTFRKMGKIEGRIFLCDFRVRIMHGETGAEDSHDVHMSRAQLMRHDGRGPEQPSNGGRIRSG